MLEINVFTSAIWLILGIGGFLRGPFPILLLVGLLLERVAVAGVRVVGAGLGVGLSSCHRAPLVC